MTKKEKFSINCIHWANCYFDFSKKGFGFGQISFDHGKGKITLNNECMDRETVREILHAFADYIADQAVLLDE